MTTDDILAIGRAAREKSYQDLMARNPDIVAEIERRLAERYERENAAVNPKAKRRRG